MKTVTLPSGRRLEIGFAPFAEAKKLYQTVMTEFKKIDVRMDDVMDINFIKNLVCTSIDSPIVEEALWPVLRRCVYESHKITLDSFETVESREDYPDICTEVIRETVTPFAKSLFAQFVTISESLEKFRTLSLAKRQKNQTFSPTSDLSMQDTAA